MAEVRTQATPVPIARLRPNPWNPNTMSPAQLKKLVEAIRLTGFHGTILARYAPACPHDTPEDFLRCTKECEAEIADGEHRCRAAKEAGLDYVPTDLVAMEDDEVRFTVLRENRLHGIFHPQKTGQLLQELKHRWSDPEIAKLSAFTAPEIKHYVTQGVKVPKQRPPKVPTELQKVFRDIMLTPPQAEIFDRAVAKAQEDLGSDDKAAALIHICQTYLAPLAQARAE